MSVADRRNSLRKSSLSVDSIRKSVTSLGEGLAAIGNKSKQLLKQTRETNQFKSRLIRKDGEYFKRRRENALRRQREDELEASTITGVTKRQGSLSQKSTKGFLGRILDFVGILIIGWAIANLPRIIAAFQKLFGLIKRVVGVLGGFVEGMKNFLEGIGTGVDNFLSIFKRFNFREDDKKIKDSFEESANNLTKLNKEFVESSQQFARDKDINSAGQVAQDLGIDEGGGEAIREQDLDFTEQQKEGIRDAVRTFSEEEVAVIEETGVIPEARAEGGDVVEGVPYVVGEQGPEIFVPKESGDIVPNDEIDEAGGGDVSNIEGTGGEETAMSVTPDKPSASGTATTSAAPTTSSLDGDDFETDGEAQTNIDPVVTDKSKSLTPVKRNRKSLRNRRRRRTVVQIPSGGGGGQLPAPTASGGTKTETIIIGNSSNKTLLDLQSLNNKHN